MTEATHPRRRPVTWRGAAILAIAAMFVLSNGADNGASSRSTAVATTDDIEEFHVAIRGAGRVVSIPRGIECNSVCDQEFAHGTEVVLVAGSRGESRFVGWKGDCVGRAALCVLIADRTATVTATFERDPDPSIGLTPHAKYFLNVTGPRAGRGGTIKSERPAVGINCPPACRKQFLNKTRVTLRAYPARGYAPVWQSYPPSVCSSDRCNVTLQNTDAHVAAAFRRAGP